MSQRLLGWTQDKTHNSASLGEVDSGIFSSLSDAFHPILYDQKLIEGFSCTKKPDCKCHKCKKPANCVLSDWQIAGPCSAECGPGMASYIRYIVSDAKNGGDCPASRKEMRPCKIKDCPGAKDCVIGDWVPIGDCDYSGKQLYFGNIITHPANGGKPCGPNTKIMDCPAPVDCIAGAWSDEWLPHEKDVKCGTTVTQKKTRTLTPAKNGGKCCDPSTEKTQQYTAPPCPVDCVIGNWSEEWIPLDKDVACGTTVTQRKTRIIIPEKNGGQCRDRSTEKTQLYTAPHCPVDCVAGGWSEWVPLDKDVECGKTVTQTKTRPITPAMYGGKCDLLPSQTRPYTAPACPPSYCAPGWTFVDHSLSSYPREIIDLCTNSSIGSISQVISAVSILQEYCCHGPSYGTCKPGNDAVALETQARAQAAIAQYGSIQQAASAVQSGLIPTFFGLPTPVPPL